MEEQLEQTISARQLGAAFSGCAGRPAISGRRCGSFRPVWPGGLAGAVPEHRAAGWASGAASAYHGPRTGRHELSFLMVPGNARRSDISGSSLSCSCSGW